MDYQRTLLRNCFLAATSLALIACGGGGGPAPEALTPETETPTSPDTPTPASTAKHFVYASKDTGDLLAVTDDNLDAPITLATAVTAYQLITAWDYDLEARTLTNFDNKLALYAKEGKIYKAELGGDYASTQVSNESNYCPDEIGSFKFGSISVGGFDDSGSSWSGYMSAGQDGECRTQDDVHRLVRIDMDSDSSPITPPGLELADIFNPDTGLLDGWLLVDPTGKLIRTNADFQSPQAIAGAPLSTQWQHLQESGSLNLLEDGATHTLHIYDESDGSFSTLVNNFHALETLADSSAFYWLDPTDQLIKKALLDGSGVGDTLADSAAELVTLTDDYVIYRNTALNHFFSVLKTGGAQPTSIFAPQTQGSVIATPNNLVYANNLPTDDASDNNFINAYIIQASNGVILRDYLHAQWIGGTMANALNLDDENLFSYQRILLMQRSESASLWTQSGGGTLVSFDPATMNNLGELGNIPDDKRLNWVFGLASSTLATDTTTPSNVFYLNTEEIGSLVPISNASEGTGFTSNSF